VKDLAGKKVNVKCTYPSYQDCEYAWNEGKSSLTVRLSKQFTARLFEMSWGE
jgi:alpha-galactosidase